MGKIDIVNLKDVEAVDEHGALARALFSRANGSNRIDFLQAEIPQGYVAEDAVYPDQDEIVYLLSGEGEIIMDGNTRKVGPGSCFFVPQNTTYSFKLTKGPAEVIAAFSPAGTE